MALLILTRKSGEGLVIGDGIRITVVEIRGKQIRLGIEAPSDVVILREEVYERVRDQNLQAAGIQESDVKEIARMWRKK